MMSAMTTVMAGTAVAMMLMMGIMAGAVMSVATRRSLLGVAVMTVRAAVTTRRGTMVTEHWRLGAFGRSRWAFTIRCWRAFGRSVGAPIPLGALIAAGALVAVPLGTAVAVALRATIVVPLGATIAAFVVGALHPHEEPGGRSATEVGTVVPLA
jgi:hypothetical protein